MKPAGDCVLDSFAVLAYLGDEPGADNVRAVIEHGRSQAGHIFMSTVNLGECLYIIERERGLESAHGAIAAMDQLPVEIVAADREETFAAAHIKAHYRVSFADAFAIALAQDKKAAVVTGDPEFTQVESLVPIHWLKR